MTHRCLLLICTCCIAGCIGSSAKVVAPKLNPADAAKKALEQYDQDSDGLIDATEAKESALDPKRGWDADGDGKISEEEIRTRLERYEALKPGIQALTCTVMWGSQTLADAEVVFEPEAFQGGAVEAARGTTDAYGVAELVVPEIVAEDPTLRGVRAGLYKVRITHPEVEIPAKFNEKTTLTFELSPFENILPPVFRLRK